MSDKIPVGIATIVNHGHFERCVESLNKQLLNPEIWVVANTHRVENNVYEYESLHRIDQAFYFEKNLGVAGSWNYLINTFLAEGADYVVITGDDILFTDKSSLNHFKDAVEKDPTHVYYAYNRGFSLFCITKEVWQKVRGFDEGFWPGYYEDNDYYRRMMLAGVGWIGLHFETEHIGSASINSDNVLRSLNQTYFPQNKNRYIAKWGGEPHKETFTIPFNGGAEYPAIGGDRIC